VGGGPAIQRGPGKNDIPGLSRTKRKGTDGKKDRWGRGGGKTQTWQNLRYWQSKKELSTGKRSRSQSGRKTKIARTRRGRNTKRKSPGQFDRELGRTRPWHRSITRLRPSQSAVSFCPWPRGGCDRRFSCKKGKTGRARGISTGIRLHKTHHIIWPREQVTLSDRKGAFIKNFACSPVSESSRKRYPPTL